MNIFDYFSVEIWLGIGFFLAGAIAGGSVCYQMGRRNAQRDFEPVFEHINHVHKSIGHKSFLILRPESIRIERSKVQNVNRKRV